MPDPEDLKSYLRKYGMLQPVRRLKQPVTHIKRRLKKRRGNVWCANRAEPVELLQDFNAELWEEAKGVNVALKERADNVLAGLEYLQLGGGGDCRLLYFLTRFTEATTVVETGVAAGWSTTAILWGLQTNDCPEARLWSSELPYDRPDIVDDYSPYVGILVDQGSKKLWNVLLEGDKQNIPKILSEVPEIDLFHYDSRKTRRAKDETLDLVLPHMKPGGVIVVDDIGDNLQFRDWTKRNSFSYRVFKCDEKFVGVVGL